jgi:DNA repair exonuclease SbcCD ATPase subunit
MAMIQGVIDDAKTLEREAIAAVSETIGILNDDDAHDLFSKTLGFIQLSSKIRRVSVKELASKKLMAAAKKANNPNMAAIAMSMKLDAFGMVKEKVQNMVDDLLAEKDEEIKFRDQCTADLHQNEMDQTAKYAEKDDLQASIDDLDNTLTTLKDEVAGLKQSITNAQIEMKRASEDREIENKDFQETVADQRATQAILTKALDRLKEFYSKKSLVQLKAKSKMGKQDPGSFTGYKKNEKSGGVMAMIQGVIDDAKNLEREAIAAEQDSQSAYEGFVSDSNKSIAAMSKSIAEKSAEIGTADEAHVTATEDMKGVMADLESLNNIGKQLHYDCDFVLKNFELRQEARDQEVEALRQSIAMLSGSSQGR